jgi:hypothetical protein
MAVSSQDIVNFFINNPGMSDAQIVSAMAQYGVSPAQMATAFAIPVEEVSARVAATLPPDQTIQLGGTVVQSQFVTQGTGEDQQIMYRPEQQVQQQVQQEVQQEVQQNTVAQTNNQQYVKDYQGTEFDPATILKLSQQITASIDPNAIKGGVFSTKGESVGFNYDEATRLLGKAPTATEQVVLDMARHLAKEGVTDLKDANLTETNRRFGSTFTGGGGTIYEIKKNAEGNPVISTWSKDTSDKKTILAGLAVAALAFGIPGVSEGLLSSAPAGATLGTTAITAAEAAGLGLTAAEAASLGLSATEFAAASATAAGTGGGLLTGGAAGGATGTGLGTGITTGASGLGINAGGALGLGSAGTGAGITAGTGLTGTGVLTGSGLGSTLLGTTAGALTGTGVLTGSGLGTTLLGTGAGTGVTGALTTGVGTGTLGAGALTTGVGTGLGTALTTDAANTITSGLKTVGGLLQTEEDKAAAKLAAKNVTAATQAGVTGSQFRPVGMTTRFGTSNYTYDPVTGQMTSAGYQLTPEAKSQQDRLANLARRGLTQAEQAQQQFAPLQTGAQNLFGLGNQYISQSPQDVAQNYINQQMQLLQPSREMDLANLQNRLYQQGRTGVSVAQGGSLGATTPELQALYNARAMQDLQLSSQAQQAGQQNVLFGAGLLGQGSQAMGNYYGGQQAAYSPFTTALGQVQNLETQAQQPLAMGANLAQQASTAGYRAGSLGVQGAQAAGALSTGKAATTNPYASLFSGFDPAFAQGIAKQIWGG